MLSLIWTLDNYLAIIKVISNDDSSFTLEVDKGGLEIVFRI